MAKFQSRLILLSLAIGAFAIGTSEFSGMTLLPFYAHDFSRDQPTAAALMPDHRGKSAFVMTGLTLATVIGAPFASVLGQIVGWRYGFVVSAGAAAISAVGLAGASNAMMAGPEAGAASELGALRNGEVWLTLAIGAIGFGGLFAVYSYLPAIAANVAGIETREVAWLLSFVGVGMFVGNLVAGWAGDRFGSTAGIAVLIWSAVVLAVLPLAPPDTPLLYAVSFAIAITAGLNLIL